MTDGAGSEPLLVMAPVFDDWPAVALLLPELDQALAGTRADVLLIDDDSRERAPAKLGEGCANLARISVLRLRENQGHQRAIAIGLAWLCECARCERIVVMDADGQDDPKDIPALLAACDADTAAFGARTRRSDALSFTLGYHCYRVLHWLLTGRKVRAGNFSAIPIAHARAIVESPTLWRHYCAAVMHAELPLRLVPSARRARSTGVSRMSFADLVRHGLAALAIYRERIAIRLLIAGAVFDIAGRWLPPTAPVGACLLGLALILLIERPAAAPHRSPDDFVAERTILHT